MKKHLWITMCEDGSYAQTKVRPTKGNYGWRVTGENGWLYDSYNFFDSIKCKSAREKRNNNRKRQRLCFKPFKE